MNENQIVEQAVVVSQSAMKPNQISSRLALFNEDGDPVTALTFEEVPTGDDVLLTGYAIAVAPSAVADTDTVNEGLGKVEYRLAALETSETGEVDTAAEVRATALTGLSLADATDVVATDTILVAIGKLQAQINAL